MENLLIIELDHLSNYLNEKTKLIETLPNLHEKLKIAMTYEPNNLSDFDSENYEKFIQSKIGEKPTYHPPIIFGVNKYNEEYAKSINEYNEKEKDAKKEYIQYFNEQRKQLLELDNNEKEELIKYLQEEISLTENKINTLNNSPIVIDGLSLEYYDLTILKKLIKCAEKFNITNLTELLLKYDYDEKYFNLVNKIDSINNTLKQLESSQKQIEERLDKIENNVYKIKMEI